MKEVSDKSVARSMVTQEFVAHSKKCRLPRIACAVRKRYGWCWGRTNDMLNQLSDRSTSHGKLRALCASETMSLLVGWNCTCRCNQCLVSGAWIQSVITPRSVDKDP